MSGTPANREETKCTTGKIRQRHRHTYERDTGNEVSFFLSIRTVRFEISPTDSSSKKRCELPLGSKWGVYSLVLIVRLK